MRTDPRVDFDGLLDRRTPMRALPRASRNRVPLGIPILSIVERRDAEG